MVLVWLMYWQNVVILHQEISKVSLCDPNTVTNGTTQVSETLLISAYIYNKVKGIAQQEKGKQYETTTQTQH